MFEESGFQSTAFGPATSYGHAIGITQILPEFYGYQYDLTDPLTSILMTARILTDNKKLHQNDDDPWKEALRDYYAGAYRTYTGQDTIDYADTIIAIWKDPTILKKILDQPGIAEMPLFYWYHRPQNPLRDRHERRWADFGESSYYQPQGHTGWDFAAAQGEPIFPVAEGKVVFKGWLYGAPDTSTGHGNTIVIEHPDRFNPLTPKFTVYAHMSEFAQIKVGQEVGKDSMIGKVGSTGASSEPHLHFAFYYGGSVDSDTREMVGGEWRHPMTVLPPGQNYPGSTKLS